ncbi:RabGAP-TBC domain containing protein [Trichuris trichiura]|uniref:RabGAP-TBC domain containing protein n=1 Tax=Trichuris trichiura TaxID=36087 RepID=A0A077Z0S6_TRITR|nr:RabGAP-TBC domain containing protein [Trichuris trichiura]
MEDWEILDADDFQVPCVSERETRKSQNAGTTNRSGILVLFGLPFHDLLCLERSEQPELVPEALSKKPLSLSEFREFVDDEGRLVSPEHFRLRVYQGGCEKRLRATAWPMLLDVFPVGMNTVDRCNYLAALSERYINLRNAWCIHLRSRVVSEQVCWIINSIRRDVIRTDRMHPFYAGDEEHNANLVSLFNVLATYALYHPEEGYCQGMSDLASPLLVVMKNEALAYVCFCALMKRLRKNFQLDGRMMTRKFKDLCELLEHYDPSFYEYLREAHADDLLFCYRWLLLELKREFTFDDALLLMEVNWASLPADPPEKELDLCCGASANPCQFLCSSWVNVTCSCAALSQHNRETDLSISNEESVYRNSFNESNHMFSFGQDDSLDSGRPIYFQSRNRFDSLSSCKSCPACFADLSSRSLTITESIIPTGDETWVQEVSASSQKRHRENGATSIEDLLPVNGSVAEESLTDIADNKSLTEWTILPLAVEECTVSDCRSVDVIDACASPVALAAEASSKLSVSSLPLKLNEIQEICAVPLSTHNSCTLTGSSEQPSRHRSCRPNDLQNGCALEDTKVKSRRTSTTTNCSATAAANVIDSGFCESHGVNTTTDLTSKASVADVGGINRLDREDVGPESGRQRIMTDQLGGGNPFLMFICVALFLEHRNLIMERKMDFNDIAMYFDSLVKRHNVRKVLQQARIFYSEYRSNCNAQRTSDVIFFGEQRRAS